MTDVEFIAETASGSLYHILYRQGLFEHHGRFSCRQLVGRTIDFGPDFSAVINFQESGQQSVGNLNLDMAHFKPGMCIVMGRFVVDGGKVIGAEPIKSTSPIVKIFRRVN